MAVLHPPSHPVGSGRDGLVPGRLHVLSCPPPLCPHVEFGAAAVLGTPVSLAWSPQPGLPGLLQATLDWAAASGTAAALAGRLRGLGPVRFDVVEGPVAGADAERYCYDPDLGLHHAALAANGDVVVGEGPLRALLAVSRTGCPGAPEKLAQGLERLLGQPWDEVLDPLRAGGEGAPVTWLRRTG